MTEVTTKQLELVASELNTLLSGEIQKQEGDEEDDEPIIPTKGKKQDIMRLIHEAVDILESSDKLTDDLCRIVEKTSLGDAVFPSHREDIAEDISIRELFVIRTKISLEMPKKEEPDPEPDVEEKEPEQEEVETIDEAPPQEPEPEEEPEEKPPVEEQVQEEVPIPKKKKASKKNATLADMKIDDLVKVLREEGVQIKRRQYPWERGKSPYSRALKLACQNPDITHAELCELFVEETGMALDDITAPGIRTARSLMRKVVGYLRTAGHMPKKQARKAK